MARRAGHEEEDHPLGLGSQGRLLRRERIGGPRVRRGQSRLAQQAAEGDCAQSYAALLQEPAPGNILGLHSTVQMILTTTHGPSISPQFSVISSQSNGFAVRSYSRLTTDDPSL